VPKGGRVGYPARPFRGYPSRVRDGAWHQTSAPLRTPRQKQTRHLHSSLRSVNGSTRPLYGRGAGSTPAGGSIQTPVAQWKSTAMRMRKSLVRIQPGASKVRGVTGSMASSNLAGPGSNPGGSVVAGRSGSGYLRKSGLRAVRFNSAFRSHPTTATRKPAAGRNGSGYRLLIDRSRVRIPPGAFALR
jgi:hypothetical protein